ncbi:hypothetical protein V8G54_022076 [Vigna mungo]|uniref:Uncharacterized protein n=1 Tax=Vigna mungo TaxID=3915 RepID=A0AAQ3NEC1_VIGMU
MLLSIFLPFFHISKAYAFIMIHTTKLNQTYHYIIFRFRRCYFPFHFPLTFSLFSLSFFHHNNQLIVNKKKKVKIFLKKGYFARYIFYSYYELLRTKERKKILISYHVSKPIY